MNRKEEITNKLLELIEHVKDAPKNEALLAVGLDIAEWADKHPQNPQLSAADRGIIDEIIFALNSLGKEKMISYDKEIEFLNKIRKL